MQAIAGTGTIQLNLLANAEGKAPCIGTTTAAVIIQPVLFRVCGAN
jgi:hypothetical protein